MNTLSAGLTVLAASALFLVITTQTQGQPAPQIDSSRNAASDAYQDQDLDGSSFDPFSEVSIKGDFNSCGQQRAAMRDAASSTAFASIASQDGMTEVALAGLALQKSHNNQVKQFAQKIVRDHAKSNLELDSIVKCENLALPMQLDAKYQTLVTSLNAKSGGTFDRAYLQHMVQEHTEVLALFKSASLSTDSNMAAFARKTLPTLQQDGQLAGNLRATAGIQVADAG